jgi:hypothetical protein
MSFNWEVGMRVHVRYSLLALLVGAIVAVSATAAQAAPGIESFFAANCKVNTCKKVPPAEEKEKAELEGFTQAAGHPNFGITDFKVKTVGAFPNQAPEGVDGKGGGIVTHVRTDVAPGVSTNPQAVPMCSMAEFNGVAGEVAPGSGLFLEPTCKPESEIGLNDVVVWLGPEASPKGGDLPIANNVVYNLQQPQGLASDFGVAVKLPKALTEALLGGPTPQLYAHTLIEGSVEWGAEAAGTGKSDYHDYFEINVSPALPLISSRLTFKGNIGVGGFLTNPTSCTGIGPQTTTKLALKFEKGESDEANYSTPIGTDGCGIVPFEPGFGLTQGNKASDQPDGITTEFSLPHDPVPTLPHLDSSQVKTATVVLPEGITLNPSAAAGLEACTPEQFGKNATTGVNTKGPVACPEGSRLGTVALNVPGLPDGSLTGHAYLGGPASGPITGPPYTLYVAAESERYAVVVRLKGETVPDATTGRLTTTFASNPEQPFSNLTVHFNGGPLAPLANSLKCEASSATTTFTPFTNTAAKSPLASFEVNGCAATLPFAPTQSTSSEPGQGGANSTFTLNFGRAPGEQYLTAIKTVLPPGLVGAISTVTPCTEAQATTNACTSASQIGTVSVASGAGSPFTFNGKVYLTGPFEGAPYGLSIVVQAIGGPFNLGPVTARAKIEVDPHTAQVIVTDSKLPSIVGGIPTRIRSVTVSVNRQGFQRNPTNCSVFSTESTLTGSFGATSTVKTPFQAEGCSALAFKPSFKAVTNGKFSKASGASIETTINQAPGQANIKSVKVQLPKQLPSRLTTLQKACLQAVFAANPASCPAGSMVGTARANTPVLPVQMKGTAYLVSHAGLAFPDLDLVLDGNGVRVILVGNTDIKKGITTTTFATTPDVPVTSITVNLPLGPHSALAAFGDLCTAALVMPTTIIGQNGKEIKQNTKIGTTGCGVRIVGHKVVGNTAFLTVRTFAAGRISATGTSVSRASRKLSRATKAATLKVPLSGRGRSRHRPLKVKLKVSFVPKKGAHSSASVNVTFR